MRSDMYEVIIERPRWGSSLRYPRARIARMMRDRDGDHARLRKMGFYKEKSLSENLSPLLRFLRTNTGRPWAKVRSEIAQHLSADSAVQKHVMDHLKDFVFDRVTPDGAGGWLGTNRFGVLARPEFFAHPRTGILVEVPRAARKQKSRARIPRPDIRVLSPSRELRRIEGIWYDVMLAPMPVAYGPLAKERLRDAVAKIDPGRYPRPLTARCASMEDVWRSRRYARSIRQLSKREIRTLLA